MSNDPDRSKKSVEASPGGVSGTPSYFILLAALILVAGAGRLYFLAHLPQRCDEHITLSNVISFYKTRSPAPQFWGYPVLFSYLSAPAVGAGALICTKAGLWKDPSEIWAHFQAGSILPVVPARILSAAFCLIAIGLTARAGRSFFDRRTALAAAALLAFSPLCLYRSAYAFPDALVMAFAAACLIYSLRILETGRTGDYLLAGAFAGLAAAAKYHAALTVVLVAVVHVMRTHRNRGSSDAKYLDRRILAAAIASVLCYLVATPVWFMDPVRTARGFLFEGTLVTQGSLGLGAIGAPYLSHLGLFWTAEKTLVFLFAAGAIYALVRRLSKQLALLLFVLAAFAFIGAWQAKRLHYLLFAYPALALLAGSAVSGAVERARSPALKRLVAAGVVALFAWPVLDTAADALDFTKPYTLDLAREWTYKNVPEGSFVFTTYGTPRLISPEEKARRLAGNHRDFWESRLSSIPTYQWSTSTREDPAAFLKADTQFLIVSESYYRRFLIAHSLLPDNPIHVRFDEGRKFFVDLLAGTNARWRKVREFDTGNGPRIIVYRNSLPVSH